MRTHRVLLATAATGLLFVPVERAVLPLLHGAPAPLYAEALAGKEGRGGSANRDRDRGDRDGKSGGHHGGGRKGGGDGAGKGHKDRAGQAGKARKDGRANARDIRPSDFVRRIDNPYFPLKPGTTFVYRGDGSLNKVTVTRRTKEILGVTTTVVRDLEFEDGELVEKTHDWYAQDKRGNVHYFGEATAEYEDGEVVSTAGSWKAGVNGARPGIVMKADPKVGDRYRLEFAPGVAEDEARVLSRDARAEVPYGRFDKALKTREVNPLEANTKENKFYARGVGQLLAVDLETGDREELVRIEREK